jgi:excisionase family DNA binding protein
MEDSILKTAAAAKLLKIGMPALQDLARRGAVPHVRCGLKGRTLRFSRAALLEWAAKGNVGNAGASAGRVGQ